MTVDTEANRQEVRDRGVFFFVCVFFQNKLIRGRPRDLVRERQKEQSFLMCGIKGLLDGISVNSHNTNT